MVDYVYVKWCKTANEIQLKGESPKPKANTATCLSDHKDAN
jgi:hypothetical protein